MTKFPTSDSRDHTVSFSESGPSGSSGSMNRRRFLAYAAATPVLTVAIRLGLDSAAPATAAAVVPSPPDPSEVFDIADAIVYASKPTMGLVVLEVGEDGQVRLELPRQEMGQGITTAMAMLIAEEMEVPLDHVDVPLADGRPELMFNQMTAGSCTLRTFYDPLRVLAATARARMIATAGRQWGVAPDRLSVRDGVVHAPDGRNASYGSLSAAAAKLSLPDLKVSPKPESEHKIVGTSTPRIDGHDIVTGRKQFTTDVAVPGAMPTMLRRPPTIQGTVEAVHNAAEVEQLPGVIGVTTVPTGVAVMAETFERARRGVNALDVTFGPGPIDGESNESIMQQLRRSIVPLAVPEVGAQTVDAEFEWPAANNAALEPECAVADVGSDRAEIWSGFQSPIVAQQRIAQELGLTQDQVTTHVMPAGGGFGRRVFWDAAMEAALVSQALGRPARVMWHRTDDMRHARVRPPTYNKIRASVLGGQVVSYEQRVAGAATDFRQGLGEILTYSADAFPTVGPRKAVGNDLFEEAVFTLMVSSPYNFGAYTKEMIPVKVGDGSTSFGMNTTSYRSVPCQTARGCEEIVADELAALLGMDPVDFRRAHVKDDRARAVLDKAAEVAGWGKRMPAGFAQGVGYHLESRSHHACIVELDARDTERPRVTRATSVLDVGKPINPLGLQAQMLGCLIDALSLTLTAGLHIVDGLPLEGSYSQYHFARQDDSPLEVHNIVMPPNDGRMGGSGEVGMAAPTGAIANAYAKATGNKPRRFPLHFPVDFEPIPPGKLPEPAFP
ncbi:MAG: molybdopterin-dependent oxidoreductase [Pseudonocardiaceae bacterium]|nr:molybdopterin-dependent oxidoreductase [Pseudonocardiaceae bacterium]